MSFVKAKLALVCNYLRQFHFVVNFISKFTVIQSHFDHEINYMINYTEIDS